MGRASRQKKLKKSLSPLAELKNIGQVDGYTMNIQKPGSVTEDWRKADQDYFREHPSESVYIRPVFPGEFPSSINAKKVEVRLVGEGARTRRIIE